MASARDVTIAFARWMLFMFSAGNAEISCVWCVGGDWVKLKDNLSHLHLTTRWRDMDAFASEMRHSWSPQRTRLMAVMNCFAIMLSWKSRYLDNNFATYYIIFLNRNRTLLVFTGLWGERILIIGRTAQTARPVVSCDWSLYC